MRSGTELNQFLRIFLLNLTLKFIHMNYRFEKNQAFYLSDKKLGFSQIYDSF